MAGTQVLRDDQIQGVPHGLLGPVAKDGFRAGIPEPNNAIAIGADHRILGVLHDLSA
jgi:hypothetical protein